MSYTKETFLDLLREKSEKALAEKYKEMAAGILLSEKKDCECDNCADGKDCPDEVKMDESLRLKGSRHSAAHYAAKANADSRHVEVGDKAHAFSGRFPNTKIHSGTVTHVHPETRHVTIKNKDGHEETHPSYSIHKGEHWSVKESNEKTYATLFSEDTYDINDLLDAMDWEQFEENTFKELGVMKADIGVLKARLKTASDSEKETIRKEISSLEAKIRRMTQTEETEVEVYEDLDTGEYFIESDILPEGEECELDGDELDEAIGHVNSNRPTLSQMRDKNPDAERKKKLHTHHSDRLKKLSDKLKTLSPDSAEHKIYKSQVDHAHKLVKQYSEAVELDESAKPSTEGQKHMERLVGHLGKLSFHSKFKDPVTKVHHEVYKLDTGHQIETHVLQHSRGSIATQRTKVEDKPKTNESVEELTERRIVVRVNALGKRRRKVVCGKGMISKNMGGGNVRCIRMTGAQKQRKKMGQRKRLRTLRQKGPAAKRKANIKRQRAFRRRKSMGLKI